MAGSPRLSKTRRKSDTSLDDDAASFDVYNSAAMTFQATGQYARAVEHYTKALSQREGDKSCLVARSICYLQLGEADKALADAVETLKEDKNFIKGVLRQAEAYYHKGCFEFALMHYHRGQKLRPEVKEFKLGIQKSQEAIDNCVGDAAGIRLSRNGDLSYFYEQQRKKKRKTVDKQKGSSHTRRTTGSSPPKDAKKSRTTQGQNQKTVKQLLGELYADKEYLEKLLEETENIENKTEANNDVHDLAEDALNYLDTRSQFWQQQKPLYCRKNEKKKNSNKRRGDQSQRDNGQWVLRRLEEIDEAQAEARFDNALSIGKKTLKQVEQLSDTDLSNRDEIISNLHSCIGNAYLELGDYEKALQHHILDKEIAYELDITDAQSRSCDNMGRVYARMGDYAEAIAVWEQKITHSKSALESTWLCHEIGRCHLELRHFNQALEYGEKSLDAAKSADDDVWNLNACVLIAQCQVKLKDYEGAIDTFEKSLGMAQLQDDKAAEKAIKRAIQDVNSRIVRREKSARSARITSDAAIESLQELDENSGDEEDHEINAEKDGKKSPGQHTAKQEKD